MTKTADQPTAPDPDLVDRVSHIYDLSKLCADEVIYRVNFLPRDRNVILRAVIRRLQEAIDNGQ